MILRSLSALTAAALILPISAYAAPSQIGSQPIVSDVIAQAPPDGERQFERGSEPRWLQELDLSDEQSERIRAIYAQSREEMEDLKQQMQQEKEQMQSLLASDATADQLRQQHNSVQNLHQQLADQRFETMLEVREVLTPEQRTQLAELKQQHGGRHRGFRGR